MERANEREKQYRNGDCGPKYLIKGPKWEGGVFILKPDQKLGCHYHNEVEETFYFPECSGKIFINGNKYDIVPGDVFRIEIGETHDIVNDTGKDIKFIFIKCPYFPEDKVNV